MAGASWVITDSDHHPPLLVARWPGGRVASHIYLVGKIYVSDNELRSMKGELSAAAKHSISLLFHCAIAWPPWPPSPPTLSFVSKDDRMRGLFSNAYCPKASAEELAT